MDAYESVEIILACDSSEFRAIASARVATIDESNVPEDRFTTLAFALHVAMALDDDARARYAAIYGRTWDAIEGASDATVETSAHTVAR